MALWPGLAMAIWPRVVDSFGRDQNKCPALKYRDYIYLFIRRPKVLTEYFLSVVHEISTGDFLVLISFYPA